MIDNYDALRNADSPEQFRAVLEAIACNLYDEAASLDSDWQDSSAGEPWRKIARGLDKIAAYKD